MKKTTQEFKDFIMRGNILDMAIGVVMGGAFGKIVTSLVDNLLMPLVGIVSGGVDIADLSWKVGKATFGYGLFLQNIIDFLIIAACMFSVVKAMAKFSSMTKKQEEEKAEEAVPEVSDEVKLLTEIKDLLAEQNSK